MYMLTPETLGYDNGPGMVRVWNGAQVAEMRNWTQVGDRDIAAGYLKSVDMQQRGMHTVTTVNELMPLELAWLQAPTDDGRVIPVGRW